MIVPDILQNHLFLFSSQYYPVIFSFRVSCEGETMQKITSVLLLSLISILKLSAVLAIHRTTLSDSFHGHSASPDEIKIFSKMFESVS